MGKITKLIISIVAPLSAGAIGSFFTSPAISNWYAFLNKPSFSPSDWLFAPIWTILYILMGIALYLVWTKEAIRKKAIGWFIIQLVLNVFWSIIFFGLKSPGWAFIEIIVLWLGILITMLKFFKISKPAGWLFLPYILWVSFALVLNFTVFILNYSCGCGN